MMSTRVLASGAAFSLALLTGCAANTSSLPSVSSGAPVGAESSSVKKMTTSTTVFVSVGSTNSVLEFPAGIANPKPIRRIKVGISGPVSIATDRNGTLYVLNGKTNPLSITEYAAGSSAPTATLTLPGYMLGNFLYNPTLAVGPDGTVYVTVEATAGNAWGVAEFYPGATTPSVFFLTTKYTYAYQGPIGVDGQNTLYSTEIPVYSYPPTFIRSFPARSTKGAFFHASAANAITFDASGNVVAAEGFHGVSVYSPQGTVVTRFSSPYASGVSFDAADNLLYMEAGSINIMNYATHTHFGTFGGVHDATSIAVSPNAY